MNLSMICEMTVEQVQVQAMECSVCKQLIGRPGTSQGDKIITAIVAGASIYAFCACCKQAVAPKWKMEYMRRHDEWRKRQKEAV